MPFILLDMRTATRFLLMARALCGIYARAPPPATRHALNHDEGQPPTRRRARQRARITPRARLCAARRRRICRARRSAPRARAYVYVYSAAAARAQRV